MERRGINRVAPSLKWLIWAFVIVVLLAIALAVLSPHFYILARVDPQEVGVRFRSGRIHEIVGPGVYGAGIVPTVDTTPEAAPEESP